MAFFQGAAHGAHFGREPLPLIEGVKSVVVDVRSAGARSLDPRGIPGAVAVDIDRVDDVCRIAAGSRNHPRLQVTE